VTSNVMIMSGVVMIMISCNIALILSVRRCHGHNSEAGCWWCRG
jgi:hypothetical protein